MKTTISLKELLDFEFTANEDGKIVAEISLERINLIADILTNQQQENKQLNSILTELEKKLNQEIDEGRSETNLWLMGIYDYAKEILLFIQELKEKYK